jgi:hypothetical protein
MVAMGADQPKRPGTCKRCGFPGHLAYQCMNHIKLDGGTGNNQVEDASIYTRMIIFSKSASNTWNK